MKKQLFFVAVLTFFLASCAKYGNYGGQTLGGAQHVTGEVDNTFSVTDVEGVTNSTAKITELKDGVSTIDFSCKVDDPTLLTMAPYIPGTSVNGKFVNGGGKAKITDQGIMNVYDDGNLVLVKWNANVGDKYSGTHNGKNITRTVVTKSTTDDYFWGWMMIKTIAVEETGRGIPGVSKVEYQTNHKFGLVGLKVYFEDGTTKNVGIYSSK